MKSLLIVALMFVSAPAFAGKMKEIYTMTNESVLETLGFYEDIAAVEGHKFLTIEGEDLAIQTTVRGYYGNATYTCLTTFVKSEGFYDVKKTVCE